MHGQECCSLIARAHSKSRLLKYKGPGYWSIKVYAPFPASWSQPEICMSVYRLLMLGGTFTRACPKQGTSRWCARHQVWPQRGRQSQHGSAEKGAMHKRLALHRELSNPGHGSWGVCSQSRGWSQHHASAWRRQHGPRTRAPAVPDPCTASSCPQPGSTACEGLAASHGPEHSTARCAIPVERGLHSAGAASTRMGKVAAHTHPRRGYIGSALRCSSSLV